MTTTPIPLGVHLNVPEDVYFADPAISRSECKVVESHSLAHWQAEIERAAAGERTTSRDMMIGSAAHVQLLEPHAWDDRYAVVDAIVKLDLPPMPPIEKEDVPEVPAVAKSTLAPPSKGGDGLWRVAGSEAGYATKSEALKHHMAWAWGGQLFVSRAEAVTARKAVADRVKPYLWKGTRYAKRADAVADRDAYAATIKPYAWGDQRFCARTDAEFARDSFVHGRIMLEPGDFVLARDMAFATRAHAKVGRCFDPDVGHAEVTVVAIIDGVRCRVRLDWLIEASKADALDLADDVRADKSAALCIDYKTARDARARAAVRSIIDYGYAMQVAMYSDVYRAATGTQMEWLFVFVEKAKPYGIRLYKLTEQFVAWGRKGYLSALAKISAARETGVYSGYSPEVEVLDLPAYLDRDDAEAQAVEGRKAIRRWNEITARRASR